MRQRSLRPKNKNYCIFLAIFLVQLACDDPRGGVIHPSHDMMTDMMSEMDRSSGGGSPIDIDQSSSDAMVEAGMILDALTAGRDEDATIEAAGMDASLGGSEVDAFVEGGEMDASTGGSPILEPPRFDHLDLVVELAAPSKQVWAELIYVERLETGRRYTKYPYAGSGNRTDFWPASTIKMYTATAALVLLEEQGFSIDAIATFSHQLNGVWVEDLSMSFREIIRRTFDCSSNETYTLLLRFAGIDWINQSFFTPSNGFLQTTLMRDYVTDDARPWSYNLTENQKITVEENRRSWTREHSWSGRSYANERGCVIYNQSGTANCTSPHDLSEHMRRLISHRSLPESERFSIGQEAYAWYRGETGEAVLNNIEGPSYCGGPAYEGVSAVFPSASFHHKEGLVSEYRGSVHHVFDADADIEYVAAIMVDDASERSIRDLSEELARMVKTPDLYVHLDYLQDYVNPISADLVTVSDEVGTLTLMIKSFGDNGLDEQGWIPLMGTQVQVPSGTSTHALRSVCLNESAQWFIRGRLQTLDGREAWSDLHYVIVDHEQPCVP